MVGRGNDIARYLVRFNRIPPASEDNVRVFELSARYRAPTDYLEFLRESGGGAGSVGDEQLILWRVSDLLKWNSHFEVDEYAPGLFFIGSNGGGEAYDMRTNDQPIVRVPFIGMKLSAIIYVAKDFRSFPAILYARNKGVNSSPPSG